MYQQELSNFVFGVTLDFWKDSSLLAFTSVAPNRLMAHNPAA